MPSQAVEYIVTTFSKFPLLYTGREGEAQASTMSIANLKSIC